MVTEQSQPRPVVKFAALVKVRSEESAISDGNVSSY